MTDNATMKLQRSHLQELLRNAKYKHQPRYHRAKVVHKVPKAVRRAIALVNRWNKTCSKLNTRREVRIDAAVTKIETEILFGSPQKVMKMIAEFKRAKFD